MPKDNLIFKLDNLEYQYHHLNGSLNDFKPRLNGTTKLYNAKGKKTSKKVTKILNEITLPEVTKELNELRTEIFNKKSYSLDKNLRSFLRKHITQYRPTKKNKKDFTPVIEDIKAKYDLEDFIELVSKSKIIKLIFTKIVATKRSSPLDWFVEHEFWKIHNDKTQEFNPSRIWTEVILKIDKCDQLISTLMNSDKCKELISSFNSGMDVFLAINRERKEQNAVKNKEAKHEGAASDSDNSEENKIPKKIKDSKTGDADNVSDIDDEILEQYDGMLVGSDEDENDGAERFSLDPKVNYNEVTDEEPDQSEDEDETNDEDDSDVEPRRKKHQAQLPELMGGYYSGGDSDSEIDSGEDRVAREQISVTEKKKNRRGQRARRKIWEKKFGREAKHIQREVENDLAERKKRQVEYEARVVKRSAKAADIEAKRAAGRENKENFEKSYKHPTKTELLSEHPSWVAKRNEEAKLKYAKFQGKKVKFD